MLASGVLFNLEKVEAEMSLEETECQSSRWVVSWDWLGITGDARMDCSCPFGAGL